jgi:hypothetical protein
LLPKLAWDNECFRIFEKAGFHVTPNLFYYPIPDTTALKSEIWTTESDLVGLDMNIVQQLQLLREVFPKYQNEWIFPYNKDPTFSEHDFFLNNSSFGGGGDAEVLHSMIRHFKPRKIIEVGAGFSTYLSARACLLNKQKDGVTTELIAVEPYPNEVLKRGFPGLSFLIQKPLEQVDLNLFARLGENDILFIDSTHVLKIGGDVKYAYLEILPRLKKGVIVHSHDIFLPFEYPKSWVLDKHLFWTEQYLLQAFLAFNSSFEILWAGHYMSRNYLNELSEVFPCFQGVHIDISVAVAKDVGSLCSGSLWMRRKKQ